MRSLGSLLALTAALLGGCTTTHQRTRPATIEALQVQLGEDATSRDTRRTDRDAVRLLYQSDVPPPAAAGEVAPLVDPSSLRGYEVKRRLPGALEGLYLGLLTGAVAGAVIGYSKGDDPACGDACFLHFSAGDKAFVGGLLLGIGGGLLGAATGGLIGHTDRYVF